MHNYLDKTSLYKRIESHRTQWQLSISDYPIDTVTLCGSFQHVTVLAAPFQTPGLRGLATKRLTPDGTDIIILNQNRNEQERNFDCGHELIHLAEHRNARTQTFHCFEKTMPHQSSFLEWQANEGAAELILPYRLFIPDFCDEIKLAKRMGINVERNVALIPEAYAQRYHVTEAFIKNRINSLIYEICQYYSGISLEELIILSRNQIAEQKLDLKSFSLYPFIRLIH